MYTLKYLFYSSIYVKLIILALCVALTIIIAMGVSKIKKLFAIKQYIKAFEEQFWSGIDMAQFYEANHEKNFNHPLGMIFKAVYEEWKASEKSRFIPGAKVDIKERMLNVAYKQKVLVMRVCENYIDAFSTFVHIAPFLGLLGTVFGLIDVFYNLDLEHGTTLTNAGIGIGGSLISLVFALLVTIISMLLFWFFNMKVQDINDKIDAYIVDLLNIFFRSLDTVVPNSTFTTTPTSFNDSFTQSENLASDEKKNNKNNNSDLDDDV